LNKPISDFQIGYHNFTPNSKPFMCPVCMGKGSSTQNDDPSGSRIVQCHPCKGEGIVWE